MSICCGFKRRHTCSIWEVTLLVKFGRYGQLVQAIRLRIFEENNAKLSKLLWYKSASAMVNHLLIFPHKDWNKERFSNNLTDTTNILQNLHLSFVFWVSTFDITIPTILIPLFPNSSWYRFIKRSTFDKQKLISSSRFSVIWPSLLFNKKSMIFSLQWYTKYFMYWLHLFSVFTKFFMVPLRNFNCFKNSKPCTINAPCLFSFWVIWHHSSKVFITTSPCWGTHITSFSLLEKNLLKYFRLSCFHSDSCIECRLAPPRYNAIISSLFKFKLSIWRHISSSPPFKCNIHANPRYMNKWFSKKESYISNYWHIELFLDNQFQNSKSSKT